MLLKNKNAIITGCNKGIGKSILETFANNGANIIACVRRETPEFLSFISEVMEETGVIIDPIYFDFENADEVKESIRTIMSLKKNLDILVNNAGIATGSLFQMTSVTELDFVMRINFTSQILFSQGISRLMSRKKRGSIINIASIAGIIGNPGTLSYGSSKAALMFATRTMATELGGNNIRVNAIAPSVTKTDMFDQMDEKAREKMINASALRRAGEPIEIANVALFLASDLSSFMTGQTLRVDGGIAI
jgi:3-oxoacyl-[acyl-carrier protein] reductase